MVKLREHFVEGIFRRPRLWSNQELRKFGTLFKGRIVNVSGAEDYDKSVTDLREYLFSSRYDAGLKYKSYFPNAEAYCLTNHPGDTYRGHTANGSLDRSSCPVQEAGCSTHSVARDSGAKRRSSSSP